VRFLGHLPDAAVAEAMASAVAVLVPGEEDFGITIAEAQAAGRPPIAFAGGGALETVEDGVSGYLFRRQTAEALAGAMARARDGFVDARALHASAMRVDANVFDAAFLALVEEGVTRASAPPPIPVPAPTTMGGG
jgi:glycosyltransferase involved in cell wall biosynthesis